MVELISVIVPAFNEVSTLGTMLGALQDCGLAPLEIIVVDDGSEDGTSDGLGAANIAVLRHEKNLGKGAAVRTGIAAASGEIIVIVDADFEYSPSDCLRLVAPIRSGDADVVYGSRYLAGGRVARGYRRWGNGLLTLLSNRFTRLDLTDMETGLKAIRSETLQCIELHENRFGFEPEVTSKLAAAGARFVEIPISYRPRGYKEGKKIRMADGFAAIRCIWQYRRSKLVSENAKQPS